MTNADKIIAVFNKVNGSKKPYLLKNLNLSQFEFRLKITDETDPQNRLQPF
jgi:hypothetical protein